MKTFPRRDNGGNNNAVARWRKWLKLSTPDKLEYIYNNYLAWLIVGGLALMVLLMILTTRGANIRTEVRVALFDYGNLRDTIESKGPEVISWNTTEFRSDSGQWFNLMAMVSYGDVDVCVGSQETILMLQGNDETYFCDLRTIDALSQFPQNQYLYTTNSANVSYPVAVEITDWFSPALDIGQERIYLAIFLNTPKVEQIVQWVTTNGEKT